MLVVSFGGSTPIKISFKKKMAQNRELMAQNPALMALIQVLNQLHHG